MMSFLFPAPWGHDACLAASGIAGKDRVAARLLSFLPSTWGRLIPDQRKTKRLKARPSLS